MAKRMAGRYHFSELGFGIERTLSMRAGAGHNLHEWRCCQVAGPAGFIDLVSGLHVLSANLDGGFPRL